MSDASIPAALTKTIKTTLDSTGSRREFLHTTAAFATHIQHCIVACRDIVSKLRAFVPDREYNPESFQTFAAFKSRHPLWNDGANALSKFLPDDKSPEQARATYSRTQMFEYWFNAAPAQRTEITTQIEAACFQYIAVTLRRASHVIYTTTNRVGTIDPEMAHRLDVSTIRFISQCRITPSFSSLTADQVNESIMYMVHAPPEIDSTVSALLNSPATQLYANFDADQTVALEKFKTLATLVASMLALNLSARLSAVDASIRTSVTKCFAELESAFASTSREVKAFESHKLNAPTVANGTARLAGIDAQTTKLKEAYDAASTAIKAIPVQDSDPKFSLKHANTLIPEDEKIIFGASVYGRPTNATDVWKTIKSEILTNEFKNAYATLTSFTVAHEYSESMLDSLHPLAVRIQHINHFMKNRQSMTQITYREVLTNNFHLWRLRVAVWNILVTHKVDAVAETSNAAWADVDPASKTQLLACCRNIPIDRNNSNAHGTSVMSVFLRRMCRQFSAVTKGENLKQNTCLWLGLMANVNIRFGKCEDVTWAVFENAVTADFCANMTVNAVAGQAYKWNTAWSEVRDNRTNSDDKDDHKDDAENLDFTVPDSNEEEVSGEETMEEDQKGLHTFYGDDKGSIAGVRRLKKLNKGLANIKGLASAFLSGGKERGVTVETVGPLLNQFAILAQNTLNSVRRWLRAEGDLVMRNTARKQIAKVNTVRNEISETRNLLGISFGEEIRTLASRFDETRTIMQSLQESIQTAKKLAQEAASKKLHYEKKKSSDVGTLLEIADNSSSASSNAFTTIDETIGAIVATHTTNRASLAQLVITAGADAVKSASDAQALCDAELEKVYAFFYLDYLIDAIARAGILSLVTAAAIESYEAKDTGAPPTAQGAKESEAWVRAFFVYNKVRTIRPKLNLSAETKNIQNGWVYSLVNHAILGTVSGNPREINADAGSTVDVPLNNLAAFNLKEMLEDIGSRTKADLAQYEATKKTEIEQRADAIVVSFLTDYAFFNKDLIPPSTRLSLATEAQKTIAQKLQVAIEAADTVATLKPSTASSMHKRQPTDAQRTAAVFWKYRLIFDYYFLCNTPVLLATELQPSSSEESMLDFIWEAVANIPCRNALSIKFDVDPDSVPSHVAFAYSAYCLAKVKAVKHASTPATDVDMFALQVIRLASNMRGLTWRQFSKSQPATIAPDTVNGIQDRVVRDTKLLGLIVTCVQNLNVNFAIVDAKIKEHETPKHLNTPELKLALANRRECAKLVALGHTICQFLDTCTRSQYDWKNIDWVNADAREAYKMFKAATKTGPTSNLAQVLIQQAEFVCNVAEKELSAIQQQHRDAYYLAKMNVARAKQEAATTDDEAKEAEKQISVVQATMNAIRLVRETAAATDSPAESDAKSDEERRATQARLAKQVRTAYDEELSKSSNMMQEELQVQDQQTWPSDREEQEQRRILTANWREQALSVYKVLDELDDFFIETRTEFFHVDNDATHERVIRVGRAAFDQFHALTNTPWQNADLPAFTIHTVLSAVLSTDRIRYNGFLPYEKIEDENTVLQMLDEAISLFCGGDDVLKSLRDPANGFVRKCEPQCIPGKYNEARRAIRIDLARALEAVNHTITSEVNSYTEITKDAARYWRVRILCDGFFLTETDPICPASPPKQLLTEFGKYLQVDFSESNVAEFTSDLRMSAFMFRMKDVIDTRILTITGLLEKEKPRNFAEEVNPERLAAVEAGADEKSADETAVAVASKKANSNAIQLEHTAALNLAHHDAKQTEERILWANMPEELTGAGTRSYKTAMNPAQIASDLLKTWGVLPNNYAMERDGVFIDASYHISDMNAPALANSMLHALSDWLHEANMVLDRDFVARDQNPGDLQECMSYFAKCGVYLHYLRYKEREVNRKPRAYWEMVVLVCCFQKLFVPNSKKNFSEADFASLQGARQGFNSSAMAKKHKQVNYEADTGEMRLLYFLWEMHKPLETRMKSATGDHSKIQAQLQALATSAINADVQDALDAANRAMYAASNSYNVFMRLIEIVGAGLQPADLSITWDFSADNDTRTPNDTAIEELNKRDKKCESTVQWVESWIATLRANLFDAHAKYWDAHAKSDWDQQITQLQSANSALEDARGCVYTARRLVYFFQAHNSLTDFDENEKNCFDQSYDMDNHYRYIDQLQRTWDEYTRQTYVKYACQQMTQMQAIDAQVTTGPAVELKTADSSSSGKRLAEMRSSYDSLLKVVENLREMRPSAAVSAALTACISQLLQAHNIMKKQVTGLADLNINPAVDRTDIEHLFTVEYIPTLAALEKHVESAQTNFTTIADGENTDLIKGLSRVATTDFAMCHAQIQARGECVSAIKLVDAMIETVVQPVLPYLNYFRTREYGAATVDPYILTQLQKFLITARHVHNYSCDLRQHLGAFSRLFEGDHNLGILSAAKIARDAYRSESAVAKAASEVKEATNAVAAVGATSETKVPITVDAAAARLEKANALGTQFMETGTACGVLLCKMVDFIMETPAALESKEMYDSVLKIADAKDVQLGRKASPDFRGWLEKLNTLIMGMEVSFDFWEKGGAAFDDDKAAKKKKKKPVAAGPAPGPTPPLVPRGGKKSKKQSQYHTDLERHEQTLRDIETYIVNTAEPLDGDARNNKAKKKLDKFLRENSDAIFANKDRLDAYFQVLTLISQQTGTTPENKAHADGLLDRAKGLRSYMTSRQGQLTKKGIARETVPTAAKSGGPGGGKGATDKPKADKNGRSPTKKQQKKNKDAEANVSDEETATLNEDDDDQSVATRTRSQMIHAKDHAPGTFEAANRGRRGGRGGQRGVRGGQRGGRGVPISQFDSGSDDEKDDEATTPIIEVDNEDGDNFEKGTDKEEEEEEEEEEEFDSRHSQQGDEEEDEEEDEDSLCYLLFAVHARVCR